MKDQDVALIVVGLAGLAFLMSKTTTDRPAENMRDFFEEPVKTFDPRPLDPGRENEEAMEAWVTGTDGYGDYRAQLQVSEGRIMNWVEAQTPDPIRKGLLEDIHRFDAWAQRLLVDMNGLQAEARIPLTSSR